jgi:type II secretory pathway component PulJ
MNKAGFSIIEFLIYLAISALIFMGVFRYFNSVQKSFATVKESALMMGWLHGACDIMAHDSMGADCNQALWHCTSDECVFKTVSGAVGWQLKKNRLYRIAGSYDFVNKKWQQRRKTIVAQQVEKFSMQPVMEGAAVDKVVLSMQMRGIYSNPQKSLEVFLYNRELA